MSSRTADFRSDTVTRPSPGMREAIARALSDDAALGDDVLDGDPTVRALEERAAAWLGKEAALFVPSGTMANQVALGVWTRPGDEVVCERSAHVVCWEGGAAGFNHGVQTLTLHAEDGALDPDELRSVVRLDSIHCPRTALVCVEQSFMGSGAAAGGRVVPQAALAAVRAVTRELGIPIHMDGARLGNAVAASGVPAERWGALADSVSVCFSKGLGAPVGSIVAGTAEFCERGRLVRKRLGGWMRQAGVIAAAALWALEHHVDRLKDDHALARTLAATLDRFEGLESPAADVQTNIVMARVTRPGHTPDSVAAALAEEGVLVLPMNATSLRFVTHMDVGPADVERVGAALARLLDG